MKKEIVYKLDRYKSIKVTVETEQEEEIINEMNKELDTINRRERREQKRTISLDELKEQANFELTDERLLEDREIEKEEQEELSERIKYAFKFLTKAQRETIYKTFWEEKSLREIARELGINNKTVYEILESGKAKLKKILKNL